MLARCWEGVTDAPCGEHGAGTGFVLYVALSRGGELCPVQSHPCSHSLDRGGVRWCGHGDISHEDIITALAATSGGCCVVTPCRIHICSFSSSPIVTLAGVWCLGGGWLEIELPYRPSVARSCCLPTRPPLARDPATWRRVHHCYVDTTQAGHEGHEGGRVSRGCEEDVTKM